LLSFLQPGEQVRGRGETAKKGEANDEFHARHLSAATKRAGRSFLRPARLST